MLPRKNRLKGKENFALLHRQGRKWSHEAFVLYALQDIPLEEGAQIGVSVSKRVSKRAVDRNRLRRLFFEAVRPLFPVLSGYRVAVVVRKKMMDMDIDAIRSALHVWIKGLVVESKEKKEL